MQLNESVGVERDADFKFWREFGFDPKRLGRGPEQSLTTTLSSGQVAVSGPDIELMSHLRHLSEPPRLLTEIDGTQTAFYLIGNDALVEAIRATAPSALTVYGPGNEIAVPSGVDRKVTGYGVANATLLSWYEPADSDDIDETPEPAPADVPTGSSDADRDREKLEAFSAPNPVVEGVALQRYSLLGRAEEIEAQVQASTPLLGNVALAGQATIIYAPPGAGKTLLTLWLLGQAIQLGRVIGGNVFYINADDNSSGAAAKARFFEDRGIHSLIPGWAGFEAKRLIGLLLEMVESGECRGVVIVVDTLKKTTDLMDKKASAAFGDAVRQFVARGGTFIGLAHTRKAPSASGRLVHGGTTDLIEDADAACVLTPLDVRGPAGEKVVQFQSSKRRGDNVDEAYAYAEGGTASYDELLASVHQVDPDNLERFVAEHEERSDQTVIDAVTAAIGKGIVMKMLLVDEVSKQASVAKRRAVRVIERYEGADPEQHHWAYAVKERGAKVYRLLTG